MKVQSQLTAAVVILALSFAMVANTSATVLIFNNAAGNLVTNVDDPIPQSYGDNVTATIQGGFAYGVGAEGFTPDVIATWGTAAGSLADPKAAINDYGDLINVAYGPFPGIRLKLSTLVGLEGTKLYSFDLGGFPPPIGGVRSNINVIIKNEVGTIIYQNLNTTVSNFPTHSTFDFSSSPLAAQLIDINISLTDNSANYGAIGIDNIVFGEIPEPSSLLFLGTGGALMALRLRRS